MTAAFALALFFLGTLICIIMPVVGQRFAPALAGTTLAWSMCLLALFQACLLGTIVARVLSIFPKWVQTAGGLLFLGVPVVLAALDRLGVGVWYSPEVYAQAPLTVSPTTLYTMFGVATAPLVTAAVLMISWYGKTNAWHARDPWFLLTFLALGGVSGLLLQRALDTPLHITMVSRLWRFGILGMPVQLLGMACLSAFSKPRSDEQAAYNPLPPLTWGRALLAMLAGLFPGALIIGLTDTLSLDIAPDTSFWIIPLGVGLLAFAASWSRLSLERCLPWTARLVGHLVFGVSGLLLAAFAVLAPDAGGVETPYASLERNKLVMLAGWSMLLPRSWIKYVQPFVVIVAIVVFFNHLMITATVFFWQIVAVYLTVRVVAMWLAESRPAAANVPGYLFWIALGTVFGAWLLIAFMPAVLFYQLGLGFALMLVLAGLFRRPWLEHGGSDFVIAILIQGNRKDYAQRRLLTRVFDAAIGVLAFLIVLCVIWQLRNSRRPGGIDIEHVIEVAAITVPVLLICLIVIARPVRLFAGLLAFVLFQVVFLQNGFGDALYLSHSPFAAIRVNRFNPPRILPQPYRSLTHGRILHGQQFEGDIEQRRIATTYYHKDGPVGRYFARWQWFPEVVPAAPANLPPAGLPMDRNRFEQRSSSPDRGTADVRAIASLVGVAGLGVGPIEAAMQTWGEAPIAVFGLGCGTMATYARPFQKMDLYEIDPAIVDISVGKNFSYLKDAAQRGADVRVLLGDPRARLKAEKIEGYYKSIVVSLFHSDAIPTHLLTREALAEYKRALAPDGVILVHVSNRYVTLEPMLRELAKELGFHHKEYADTDTLRSDRTSSTWVGLANDARTLQDWRPFPPRDRGFQIDAVERPDIHLWIDGHTPILQILRTAKDAQFFRGMLALLLIVTVILILLETLKSLIRKEAPQPVVTLEEVPPMLPFAADAAPRPPPVPSTDIYDPGRS